MAVASRGSTGTVQEAKKAVAKSQPWLEPIARWGYVAKGLVYLLIGLLAILAAWHVNVGQRGDDTNQRGILNFLARQWYGTAVLIAIAVGLSGYALWRFISATLNPERKGVWKRIGYAFSGLAYGYLGYLAVMEVLGSKADSSEKGFAWKLVQQPLGHFLLVVAGGVILGIAAAQAWNAISGKFNEVFERDRMKAWERKTANFLGRAGFGARAILFGLIGGFFVNAGIREDANSAGGVNQALATMRHSIGGNWVLVADCAGLICYGVFMIFEARYRRIQLTDTEEVPSLSSNTSS